MQLIILEIFNCSLWLLREHQTIGAADIQAQRKQHRGPSDTWHTQGTVLAVRWVLPLILVQPEKW